MRRVLSRPALLVLGLFGLTALVSAACGGEKAPAVQTVVVEKVVERTVVVEKVVVQTATPTSAPAPTPRPTTSGSSILNLALGARIPAPDVWNPYVPGSFILNGMNQILMEPLFYLNYETGQIDPWLASGWSLEGADQWTITVRNGAQWSDGQPLGAEDVAFTVKLLLDNAPKLNWSVAIARWVKEVQAIDQQRVKFTLKGSNPRFVLENFAGTTSQAIVPLPKHAWSGKDPITYKNTSKDGAGYPVFSGQYKVKDFDVERFFYVRNDNWWGAKTGFKKLPEPTEVRWSWLPNPETTLALLVDNKLDFAGVSNLGVLNTVLAKNSKLKPWNNAAPFAWRDPCPRMLSVNHTVAPWGDKEMRWALNHAINRDEIVSVIWQGATVPASFIFPDYPGMERYINAIGDITKPVIDFSKDKAAAILQKKGYTKKGAFFVGPDGKALTLDIVAPTFMREVAVLVGEQLMRNAGIDVAVRIREFGIFRQETGTNNYQASTDWSGCGSTVEPWFGMNRYSEDWIRPSGEQQTEYVDNSNNVVRWKSAGYTGLMKQMENLPIGDPRVVGLLKEAAQIWVDELPAIPLIQQPAIIVHNYTNWTNWPTKQNNYVHPPMHWSTAHRIINELKRAN